MSTHSLGAQSYARYAEQVGIIVTRVFANKSEPEMAGRTGAYFCVSRTGISISGGLIGLVSLDKREKCDQRSRERCGRLYKHRESGHVSSRQSAIDHEGIGAVAGANCEYGFAGYPADVNEIAAALLALCCKDLQHDQAVKILGRNKYVHLFKDQFTAATNERRYASL